MIQFLQFLFALIGLISASFVLIYAIGLGWNTLASASEDKRMNAERLFTLLEKIEANTARIDGTTNPTEPS
jgi:hypothetical protein